MDLQTSSETIEIDYNETESSYPECTIVHSVAGTGAKGKSYVVDTVVIVERHCRARDARRECLSVSRTRRRHISPQARLMGKHRRGRSRGTSVARNSPIPVLRSVSASRSKTSATATAKATSQIETIHQQQQPKQDNRDDTPKRKQST